MNKRFISVLLFALVVSGGASLMVYRLVSSRLSAAAKPGESKVVVASRDLPVGTLIKDLDVRLADWSGPIPQQAILKIEDAVNRGVIAGVFADEPILDTRLAPKGAGAGLAATIPEGMRAVAVRVNDVVGVAGFVVPGMRVDVLISGMPPQGPQALGTQTKTILQNIEVLSAGQNIQRDAEGKPVQVPVVNLLVTPEQAEILSLASSETRIQLVLRNPLDQEQAKPPGTAVARLFAGPQAPRPPETGKPKAVRAPVASRPPEPPAKPAPPPPPTVVEMLHGSTKTEAKFAPAAPEEAKP